MSVARSPPSPRLSQLGDPLPPPSVCDSPGGGESGAGRPARRTDRARSSARDGRWGDRRRTGDVTATEAGDWLPLSAGGTTPLRRPGGGGDLAVGLPVFQ